MVKIFLEGLPAAGKSSFIRSLEEQGHLVEHELGHVLQAHEFPGDGQTLEEILAIDDWFIQKESDRLCRNKIWYDRSYLTHLAYSYAYGRHMGIPSFKHTVEKYKAALDSEILCPPNSVVYIEVSPEISIQRQLHRVRNLEEHDLPSFWKSPSFLADLDVAYKTLFEVSDIYVHIVSDLKSINIIELSTNESVGYFHLDRYMESLND